MSKKDMLGPCTRALVSASQESLRVITLLANFLSGKDKNSWYAYLKHLVQHDIPRAWRLPVWITFTVVNQNGDTALKILEDKGGFVSHIVKDMLLSLSYVKLQHPVELKLIRCKIRDLGSLHDEQPTVAEVWTRIQAIGGRLCPPELGPQLVSDNRVKENGNVLIVVMEQFLHYGKIPYVWNLGLTDGKNLNAAMAAPHQPCGMDTEVVFALDERMQ